MKHTTILLGIAAIVVALAAPARAQGMGPGGMHGYGPWAAQQGTPTVTADQAVARARQYLGQYANPDLAAVELIEFPTVFYVVVQERSTGKGAFALLVNRVNGNVSPEMGPPMMWNVKYGHPAGGFGGHPMGGMGQGYGPGSMGPGMMGQGFSPQPGVRPVQAAPGTPPQVAPMDEARARGALQAWATQTFPGAGIGKALEFPGFFTYRLVRDGKPFALVSVNAYGGQVWYAWQYGPIVREQAIR
jgi:hypothetical protein